MDKIESGSRLTYSTYNFESSTIARQKRTSPTAHRIFEYIHSGGPSIPNLVTDCAKRNTAPWKSPSSSKARTCSLKCQWNSNLTTKSVYKSTRPRCDASRWLGPADGCKPRRRHQRWNDWRSVSLRSRFWTTYVTTSQRWNMGLLTRYITTLTWWFTRRPLITKSQKKGCLPWLIIKLSKCLIILKIIKDIFTFWIGFGLARVDEIKSGKIHVVFPSQPITGLLMHWWCWEPLHQQAWYWSPKAGIFRL